LLLVLAVAGCRDAYEPFAAVRVGMAVADVKAIVGEPDAVRGVEDLASNDTCVAAKGAELLLYRLKNPPLRFWQQAVERTVRICVDSEDKVVAKDVQIVTR
jgi:hypothetical protein